MEKGSEFWKGKRVVELGAGCGLAGLVAAGLGAEEVLLTDQHIALLEHNAAKNAAVTTPAAVKVQQLRWGDVSAAAAALGSPPRPFDVVLGADVLQEAGGIVGDCGGLVASVVGLCTPPPAPAIFYLCQPAGDPAQMLPLISALKSEGFTLKVVVPPRDVSPIAVFEFSRP